MTIIIAQRAIQATLPGQRGFRLVGRTGTVPNSSDVEKLFAEFAVGNLAPPGNTGNDSPPWFTFGSVWGQANQGIDRHFAVVKRHWSHEHDVEGRDILVSDCIYFNWEQLSGSPITFSGLVKAFPPPIFPTESTSADLKPVELRLPPRDATIRYLVSSIRGFDSEMLTQVASIASAKRLALVSERGMSLEARLAVLDAIVALLPFGCRAYLTASTWLESASTSRSIGIAFTDSRQDKEQGRVEWNNGPKAPIDRNEIDVTLASDLLEALKLLGPEELVGCLLDARSPMPCSAAGSLLEGILEPTRIHTRIAAADLSLEQCRHFLVPSVFNTLEVEACHKVIAASLRLLPEADAYLLIPVWDPGFIPDLLALASQLFEANTFDTDCFRTLQLIAERVQCSDRFLIQLSTLVRTRRKHSNSEAYLRAVAQTFVDGLMTIVNVGSVWGTALEEDSDLLTHVLRNLLDRLESDPARTELEDFLIWFVPSEFSIQRALVPFAVAAGLQKRPLLVEEIAAAEERFGGSSLQALELAIKSNRVDHDVANGFALAMTCWVAGTYERDEPRHSPKAFRAGTELAAILEMPSKARTSNILQVVRCINAWSVEARPHSGDKSPEVEWVDGLGIAEYWTAFHRVTAATPRLRDRLSPNFFDTLFKRCESGLDDEKESLGVIEQYFDSFSENITPRILNQVARIAIDLLQLHPDLWTLGLGRLLQRAGFVAEERQIKLAAWLGENPNINKVSEKVVEWLVESGGRLDEAVRGLAISRSIATLERYDTLMGVLENAYNRTHTGGWNGIRRALSLAAIDGSLSNELANAMRGRTVSAIRSHMDELERLMATPGFELESELESELAQQIQRIQTSIRFGHPRMTSETVAIAPSSTRNWLRRKGKST